MDFKLGSATGTKSRGVSAKYRPEVILTIGSDRSIDGYNIGDKMKYIDKFINDFNHNEFYANLTNDLRVNPGLVFMKMKKNMEITKPKDIIEFNELFLKIDREESDFTAEIISEIQELELEHNINKKAKKGQRPKFTPSMGGGDDDKKKKEENKFKAPKLSM